MEKKLIKTMDLPNGLVLELYDRSKKIADKGEHQAKPDSKAKRNVSGDIWLVSIVGKMQVLVLDSYFKDMGESVLTADAVRDVLGQSVEYEKKMERHFIHESEKDEIFSELIENFNSQSVKYLSHPEFGRRYILKCYAEENKKRMMNS